MLAQVAAVDLCSSYRILGAQQRMHSHSLGRPQSRIWEGCSALCRCNTGGQAPLCRDRSAAAGLGCNMCPQSGGAVGERESIAKPHRYCPITEEKFLPNHIFSHFSWAIQLRYTCMGPLSHRQSVSDQNIIWHISDTLKIKKRHLEEAEEKRKITYKETIILMVDF